jgi:hypothetical protein
MSRKKMEAIKVVTSGVTISTHHQTMYHRNLIIVNSGSPSLLSHEISTALDTLNHKLLLKRAQDLFGFTGKANLRLASYLSDCSSFMSMGAT